MGSPARAAHGPLAGQLPGRGTCWMGGPATSPPAGPSATKLVAFRKWAEKRCHKEDVLDFQNTFLTSFGLVLSGQSMFLFETASAELQ